MESCQVASDACKKRLFIHKSCCNWPKLVHLQYQKVLHHCPYTYCPDCACASVTPLCCFTHEQLSVLTLGIFHAASASGHALANTACARCYITVTIEKTLGIFHAASASGHALANTACARCYITVTIEKNQLQYVGKVQFEL